MTDPTTARPDRPIRAPRGRALSCKGWPQEAALRMLMNNLDPDVAERPEDLVVYGGSGKAARNWEAIDASSPRSDRLEDDETLLVQSGKPVGVFRTHPDAPRVLIANAMLVPAWATGTTSADSRRSGLTMYGQMTAGSWIYIGTQGILQGTYETFAACARQALRRLARGAPRADRRAGRHGRRPAARRHHERGRRPLRRGRSRRASSGALRLGYVDRVARVARRGPRAGPSGPARAARRCRSRSHGNAADVLPELARRGVRPDVVTDQTSAHDMLNGYVPAGLSLEAARGLRARDPGVSRSARYESMARHVRAMLDFQRDGAVALRLRQQHPPPGARTPGVGRLRLSRLRARLHPAALLRGARAVPLGRALRRSGGHPATTDRALMETFPHDERLVRWLRLAQRARAVPGPAGPHLLARLRRARDGRAAVQRPRRVRAGARRRS